MCRVEAVGQHGLRVGEVLRVPEVDGVEGHGFAFLSVVFKVGAGRMPDLLLRFYCFLKSCQLWERSTWPSESAFRRPLSLYFLIVYGKDAL